MYYIVEVMKKLGFEKIIDDILYEWIFLCFLYFKSNFYVLYCLSDEI